MTLDPYLKDCVEYLREHAAAIEYDSAVWTPEWHSEHIAQRGVYFPPETLIAACKEIGFGVRKVAGRTVLQFTLVNPLAAVRRR